MGKVCMGKNLVMMGLEGEPTGAEVKRNLTQFGCFLGMA